MRQKLFTKQIDDMLFKQYAMGNDLSKQKVVAKIFNPYGNGVYYLLNSDPNDPDYIWAIVDLFEVEVGSVSREDLQTIKVPPFGLNLERDMYFQPVNAQELLQRVMQGERFEKGGKINLGNVVEVKEPNYGYDDSYYVVSNKAGRDSDGFFISPTRARLKDVFEEEQLRKLYAEGGELQIVQDKGGESYLATADSTPNDITVKLADGGMMDRSDLQGLIGLNFQLDLEGRGGSSEHKIVDIRVTPAKYSRRDLTLITKEGGEDKIPFEKVDEFLNNDEVVLKDSKGESYAITLIDLFEPMVVRTQFEEQDFEYAKGGMVVTSIKDIPNFKQRLDEGKITYRGLGMGKVYNDFYNMAGESGTRIKVDGKEYFITKTEFDTFSRGSDGLMRIRFDAPHRKGYAKGGKIVGYEVEYEKLVDGERERDIKSFKTKEDAEAFAKENYGYVDNVYEGQYEMAKGGKTSGIEWDKDEDGYRTELGTFKINISPSTQKGYWNVYVSENKKSIGNEYDVYGIDNAKDKAYDIISNIYKMADGGMMAKGGFLDVAIPTNNEKEFKDEILKSDVYDIEFLKNIDSNGGKYAMYRTNPDSRKNYQYVKKLVAKYKGWVKNEYADGGKLRNGKDRYQKGDEGMYEGDAVRVVKLDNGSNIYVFDKIDDDDKVIGHGTAKREKFEKSFAYFPKRAKGGVTFDDKVTSISKRLLKGKKVSPKVQKDYGKTYDKKEALESAKRIVGAIRKKEMSKKKR